MKKFLKLSIAMLVLSAGIVSNVYAQTKIGHLNSTELLSGLIDWQNAQKELETFATKKREALEQQSKVLVDDYNKLVEQDSKGLLPPAEKQRKADDFQKHQTDLEQQQQLAQQEVLKKEQDLTDPIRKKVTDAIAAVAKEKGYNYVIDTSLGVTLFENPNDDITPFVKDKLR